MTAIMTERDGVQQLSVPVARETADHPTSESPLALQCDLAVLCLDQVGEAERGRSPMGATTCIVTNLA